MSEKTKKNIQKVIEEYNYIPNILARGLSKNKTNLLGVLVGDITNSFSSQIVKGIEKRAHKAGYQIIIGSSNYNDKEENIFIHKLIQMGVDGFIIQPTKNFKKNINLIKKSKKELVFIDSQTDEKNVISIKSDNTKSVYNCISKLIKNNYYEKYIMIGGNTEALSTRLERAEGFFNALKSQNLTSEFITVPNYANEKIVKEKLLKILNLNEKTLIFVPNCWLLPTIFKVLKEYRNLIPQNIGLLGFDNLDWTGFVSPTVTTIVQPAYDEGYLVADKLISLINGEKNISSETLSLIHI